MKIEKFVLIVFCFLSLVLINACFKEIPIEEVTRCEFDSDCIMTFDAGCCKCQTAINSDYQEYWDELNKKKSKGCDEVECEACAPSKAIDKKCINTTCTVLYSPVGI